MEIAIKTSRRYERKDPEGHSRFETMMCECMAIPASECVYSQGELYDCFKDRPGLECVGQIGSGIAAATTNRGVQEWEMVNGYMAPRWERG